MKAVCFPVLLVLVLGFASCVPGSTGTGGIIAAQAAAAKADTLDMELPFGLRFGTPLDQAHRVLKEADQYSVIPGNLFGTFFAPYFIGGALYVVDIELIVGENKTLGMLKLSFPPGIKPKRLVRHLKKEYRGYDYYRDGSDHLWINHNKGIRLFSGAGEIYLLFRNYRAPESFTIQL